MNKLILGSVLFSVASFASELKCDVERYDGHAFSSIASLAGGSEESVSFEYGSLKFYVSAVRKEGVIYFASIYDDTLRTGSQVQLLKKPELHLQFFRGSEIFSLDCNI